MKRQILFAGILCAGSAVSASLPFEPSFTMTFGTAAETNVAFVVRASEMMSCDILSGETAVDYVWRGHPRCGDSFEVVGSFRPREDGGWDYAFRYANATNASVDVEEIRFPEITVSRTDATRLVRQRQTGQVILPKWREFNPGAVITHFGPQSVGFHFLATLDDAEGGWYVDQRGDARLRTCRYIYTQGKRPMTVKLSACYIPSALPELRRAGALPFGGVIRHFQGGWFAPASFYREWVKTEDWFRRAKSRDFGKLRDIALWMWNRGRSDEVAPPVERFMEETGLTAALNWYWWHEIPYDTAYPFFWPPREPVEAFRATISRLRSKGAYVQVYTNGMLWDKSDVRWTAEGEAEVMRLRDGRAKTQVFNVFTKAETAWMCGHAPAFQSRLRAVGRELGASGLDGVYLDMIANCGCLPCWSESHGHPRGGGRILADGYRRLLADVRAENPGLQLSSEEEGEAFLELLDSIIVLYACSERLGCGTLPDVEMPPIFEAIYHGAIAMFGSYSVIDGITPWDEKWGKRPEIDEAKWAGRFPDQFACEFARGVVYGIQPCVHKVMLSHLTDPQWATDWKFVTDTARFYYAHREFLFDGEMLEPGRMICDSTAVDFFIRGCYTHEEKFRTCRQEALPAVFHSVWRAPDGRVAAVVVNRTREPRAYRLETPDVVASGTLQPLSWELVGGGCK